MDNHTKQVILDRLFASSAICGHCGKKECAGKQSHATLPSAISSDAVLRAINLDEYFFKESA